LTVDSLKDNKIIRAAHNLMQKRGLIIIVIAALTAVAVTIVVISIFGAARDFIYGAELSQLERLHNNLVRLDIFRLCVILFLILSASAICIMLCLNIKLEYLFLVAALCFGLTYMFVMTPMSIPDEMHHYHSAYAIAGYMLFDNNPMLVDTRHFDYRMIASHRNISPAYLRLIDEGVFRLYGYGQLIELPMPYDFRYPIQHLPQALGIFIARLLNLSFLGVFYSGRFFNLLFYLLCVFLAIKRLSGFRLPLLMIGLLPMSLQQAASFSSDAFINGISILLIAYSVYYAYEKESFNWRDFATLLFLGILLAPAKMVYAPIALLAILAAKKWRESEGTKAWLLGGIIVAVSAAVAIVTFILISVFGEAFGPEINWEGGHNYTVAFVFENPITALLIFLRTIYHDFECYTYCAFGWYLSGLTITLPISYPRIIIAICILSVFYGNRDEWKPAIFDRFVFIVISGAVVLLTMISMFLGHTSDFHVIIRGIQGRYFVPLLPLAALMIRHNRILVPYRFFRNALIIALISMQIAVIMYVLNYTVGIDLTEFAIKLTYICCDV